MNDLLAARSQMAMSLAFHIVLKQLVTTQPRGVQGNTRERLDRGPLSR